MDILFTVATGSSFLLTVTRSWVPGAQSVAPTADLPVRGVPNTVPLTNNLSGILISFIVLVSFTNGLHGHHLPGHNSQVKNDIISSLNI